MLSDFLNILLAFFEGLGLIVSPCILPILPIILSGSLTGNIRRPLGIIVGFVIAFALFTIFSRMLVRETGIDLGVVRHISYVLLIVFGIVMMSTRLTEKFNIWTSRLTSIGSNVSIINDQQGGFLSGILFGFLVAIIWTPCAGPILAAVIVQTVIQKTSFMSFLTVLFFGLGAAIPMFIIALFGRKLMEKLSFLKKHTILIRKLLGAIIIIAVFYMINNEAAMAISFSSSNTGNINGSKLENALMDAYPAPQIEGITEWINSKPLTLKDLKGKVVLIDFWTYSCINCVRTLPYLKDWYNKYHNKGLVIIGVHSPEFEFEKDVNNVKNAVIKEGIQYPVALDNNFVTWQNFQNQYWPAHYLIDKNGYVVYQHFGEGDYDITENNIRYLLGMNKENLSAGPEVVSSEQTPETYLGIARQENYKSPEKITEDVLGVFTYPSSLDKDEWGLQGSWIVKIDRIMSGAPNASIKLHFYAGKVYIVMGNENNKSIPVKFLLNGKEIKTIMVSQHTLYDAVSLPKAEDGELEIIAKEPGLEVYTFTFGN